MARPELTPQQEADAQALAAKIHEKASDEILEIARGLVGRPDRELFGPGEFAVRDQVLKIGAKAIELELEERKKGVPRC